MLIFTAVYISLHVKGGQAMVCTIIFLEHGLLDQVMSKLLSNMHHFAEKTKQVSYIT